MSQEAESDRSNLHETLFGEGEHPYDWALQKYATRGLSPEARQEISAHVANCQRCAEEINGYRTIYTRGTGRPPGPSGAGTNVGG